MAEKKKELQVESVDPKTLKPHPRNYREHPDDQLDHIAESIRVNGFYRNVVVADDYTILAGHGVVKAALRAGYDKVPVVRVAGLKPDDPRAMRLLIGDNEISSLAAVDDRVLTDALKELKDADPAYLLGTGFSEQLLANLVFVTRTRDEIVDKDEATQWIGMPEFSVGVKPYSLVVQFASTEARDEFCAKSAISPEEMTKFKAKSNVWSTWWPQGDGGDDLSSVKFVEKKEVAAP